MYKTHSCFCRGVGWGVEGSRLEAWMKGHKSEVAITFICTPTNQETEYYTLHVIYHMNCTQVMRAISNHDFNTKPYVKAPQYDKTFR